MIKDKRVDIIAVNPIHGAFMYPLQGAVLNQDVTEDQIYRCLVGGAEVTEILPNGTRVPLNFKNYNKDNGGKLVVNIPKVKAEDVSVQPQVKPQEKVTLSFTKNEAVEEKAAEAVEIQEEVAEAKEVQEEAVEVKEEVQEDVPVAAQEEQRRQQPNFNKRR